MRSVDPAELHDATVAGDRVDKRVRNVLTNLGPSVAGQMNATLQRIVDEMVEPFYGVQIDYWEAPVILVYPPGGFFLPHNDDEDVIYDEEQGIFKWRRTNATPRQRPKLPPANGHEE